MADHNKYIKSTGTHYISNSGHDENGKYHGGKAGDQTGGEWQLRKWYDRPWTHVLRLADQNAALLAAQLSIDAALNNNIGYDQYQRKTFWNALEKCGYRPANIATKCEADCTAGVTAVWKCVGHLLGIDKLANLAIDTYSGNLRSRFKAAGFTVLTASKYTDGTAYLMPGDVLLYENHHAALNITLGKKAGAWNPSGGTVIVDDDDFEILRRGSEGAAVRALQSNLLALGYGLPRYGADGDFGAETETALKQFQRDNGLDTDGEYGPKTDAAMQTELGRLRPKQVRITGDKVNVRTAPNVLTGRILGIAHKDDLLEYQGEDKSGWHLVVYGGLNAWVSGKYSEVISK